MIKIKNISKSYINNEELLVLEKINLDISKGDIVSIMGTSGVGKTTLLNIIGCLINPDSGSVFINGLNVNDLLNNTKRAQYFGYIFQSHYLLPEFSVLDNLVLPQIITKKTKKESLLKAYELLNYLNIEDLAFNYPNQLSLGQSQRISILRAVINNPLILIADEPTGNLDENNSELILDLFVKLNKRLNQTIIIATHDKKIMKISNSSYEIINKDIESIKNE